MKKKNFFLVKKQLSINHINKKKNAQRLELRAKIEK